MNINISDFALIIPIDKNKIVYGEYRYYEFEAVRLLKSFRKNAGIFKNINIYIFQNKNIDISKNTINEINKMHNVFLFEDEVKNPNKYKFINIPYTGYYFTNVKKIKEKYTFYFDLDCEIVNPINKDFIEKMIQSNCTIIPKAEDGGDNEQKKIKIKKVADTKMILSPTFNDFYNNYFQILYNNKFISFYNAIDKRIFDYYHDEFAIQYMIEKNITNISLVDMCYVDKSIDEKGFLYHNHITHKQIIKKNI